MIEEFFFSPLSILWGYALRGAESRAKYGKMIILWWANIHFWGVSHEPGMVKRLALDRQLGTVPEAWKMGIGAQNGSKVFF